MNTHNHQIILAPLHGFTEYAFRNVYARHFSGIDWAISPFVSLNTGEKINPRRVKDLFIENNHSVPIIPQILGNDPDLFIQMANYIYNMGYDEINWNLGCPIKKIANKKRGSGMLPYPDLLDELLGKIIPNIKNKLSVKIRLGYSSTYEVYKVMEVLNKYPLTNVCIHPRLGIQMYEGDLYLNVFNDIIKHTKHDIIYNGDINTLSDFSDKINNYPKINKWMIGRGIIHNPFLPQIIKNNYKYTHEEAVEKFYLFITDLLNELLLTKNELPTLYKMKDYWKYFCIRFVYSEKVFESITHTATIAELRDKTEELFSTEVISNWVR